MKLNFKKIENEKINYIIQRKDIIIHFFSLIFYNKTIIIINTIFII